jgi:cyclic beta-1,2-glucan synthetase
MSKENYRVERLFKHAKTRFKENFFLVLAMVVFAIFVPTVEPAPVPSSFSILDARERGAFNIGLALGNLFTEFDQDIQREVLKLEYWVSAMTMVGIWTKGYYPGLEGHKLDGVSFGVKVPNPEQLEQVSVKLELKGKKAMQTLPIDLKAGWNSSRAAVDWNLIGELKEVVFVVSPRVISENGENPLWFNPAEFGPPDSQKRVEGIMYCYLDFYKLSFLEKNLIFVRLGLLLVVSLFLTWITAFLRKVFIRRHSSLPARAVSDASLIRKISRDGFFSRLKTDFLYGIAAVLIAGCALSIYSLGSISFPGKSFSFNFLVVGLMGAVIAQLLKFIFIRQYLSPGEVLGNTMLTGLLAVSASGLGVLQTPSTWTQVLMLNKIIATVVFLVYQVSNARSFAFSCRHLKASNSALIIATPYLFGWLLLLQNQTLLQALANTMTAGILAAWPGLLKLLGRVFIVFGFNEAVTNGISLVIKGKPLRSPRTHILILLVSLGAVIAALIANLGSGTSVASLPLLIKAMVVVVTTMLAFAGLWGEVYLLTGIVIDAGKRTEPSWETISKHVLTGMRKGLAYSGILTGLLYALHILLKVQAWQRLSTQLPIILGMLSGGLFFPLLKTIIETFDGSLPFSKRIRYNYRDGVLYARGLVAGCGFAYALSHGLIQWPMFNRVIFGLSVGLVASLGVSFLRDSVYAHRGQGRIQPWRLYFVDGLLGAFVGSALAFYLDSLQVPVIVEKFKLYISAGFSPREYLTYPLVNKWGRINLGSYTGGARLLFTESLAGVINWSIAAWLFAINKVLMQAFFEKHTAPIKFFFSKAGFAQLVEHMIYVLRWGLWMSPIIFSFLRMMPEPTWYNQDGGIRTLFAIYHNATMSPQAFKTWSLNLFVYILAFDFFRVLIWMDHMGLRVATLVNLSFIGLDRLDERLARFIGSAAAQRYIPEAVKRFVTWGPLLIPFYLPRGKDWDYAWNMSEAIQNSVGRGGLFSNLQPMALSKRLILALSAILICTGISFIVRSLRHRSRHRRIKIYQLGDRGYRVFLKENGEIYSEVDHKKSDVFPKEYDISRRSYDIIDPCGRTLYIVDASQPAAEPRRFWPVIGNFPRERFEASGIERDERSFRIVNTSHGVRTTINISLPDDHSTAELWEVTVNNLTDKTRFLKIVPYLEWVLMGGVHDRFHTQYARLFPEVEYVSLTNAILSWHRTTKSIGVLAADVSPEGILFSRLDFIGRAQSIWKPRILETLDFMAARDRAPHPSFDPIGALLINATVNAKDSLKIRLLIGYATNKKDSFELISRHLKIKPPLPKTTAVTEKKPWLIGHGEILPGTPQPYFKYIDNGNKLLVRTAYTPRPYDHAMSNSRGHSVMVTNRGLHTSCNGNSQQNRLTPDCPDFVTKEIPSEAIYLYEPDKDKWYCPTYHPLNEPKASYESEFGVDGTAVFRMKNSDISTELTVFVPPDEPLGVYLLTIKNNSPHSRHIRVAPYFQMVLEFQPEKTGSLQMYYDRITNALFFRNPRNMFRVGWAFASVSLARVCVETRRGRFFGRRCSLSHPFMVEKGKPDATGLSDDRPIAAFLGTVDIPAQSQETFVIVLGQTDKQQDALRLVKKYKDIKITLKSLEDTRRWWLSLMETVNIQSNKPEFDQFQNWLKYQTLAERIWARRGFYQTSGAYGFRDQLQDALNLVWVEPSLARKQILLHASHQFPEGDVYHWFFTLTDGRTAFSCRSHASDNPLWLVWAVVEYIKATADYTILDEMTSYVVSEFPFEALPKNKGGWGHLYHRSTREDSVYRHCMKSIDLVLEKRMGRNGLPLIQTGDWNDGLDEIGSEGRGESVWVGFFLYYILKDMVDIIEKKEGPARKEHYLKKMQGLKARLEATWRHDRYLRAIHDDGTEIGVKDSGIWEIDALTAAWVVMAGINPERGVKLFDTALYILEREKVVLLGWPALREDTTPYLGRSSRYPEGVRENGMYCHGVQWLIKAARILAEQFERQADYAKANEYRQIAYRLWMKISPIFHVTEQKIEIYGGQPNKQPADILTTFDEGRMIWNGYTGAAGWMLRQALEAVIGASLVNNEVLLPSDLDKLRGELKVSRVYRDLKRSPFSLDRPVKCPHSPQCYCYYL